MKLSSTLLVNIIGFVILLFVFIFLAVEVVIAEADHFDRKAFTFFAPYVHNPEVVSLMRRVTFFGSPIFLFTAHFLLGIILLLKKNWVDAFALSIIAVCGYGLQLLLKFHFQRVRPGLTYLELIGTPSFPSGHAMSSIIFSVIIIYLVGKTQIRSVWKWLLAILLIFFSLLIGLSRVILQLHYASDVIAGFCIGIVWTLFALWLKERLMKLSSKLLLLLIAFVILLLVFSFLAAVLTYVAHKILKQFPELSGSD